MASTSTIFALEMPVNINENYPDTLREYWGNETILNPLSMFEKVQKKAQEVFASYVCIYFNIESDKEIEACEKILKDIVSIATTPLMIKGCGQKPIDEKLLVKLIPILKTESIVASAQDQNYKAIVKAIAKTNHKLVLRTPIDINLTKELNILSTDIGLKHENILIDPDMGCVGYGLDYGYSIIERIKLAKAAGDKMLDMPIIVFSGEESFKAKESKSKDFGASWGELKTRSMAWEITTTTSLICAGADYVVVWHPKTIQTLNPRAGGVLC